MSANLDIIKNNITYTTKGGEDFFANNVRITEIYVKKDGKETLVWQYDVTPPTIVMSAPTSGDSNNPTVTYSSTYIVKGTYEDTESGIKSITVNDVNATLDNGAFTCSIGLSNRVTTGVTVKAVDNAGNVTTVVTYVIYVVSETISVSNYSGSTTASVTNAGSANSNPVRVDAKCYATAWFHIPRYTKSISAFISPGAGWHEENHYVGGVDHNACSTTALYLQDTSGNTLVNFGAGSYSRTVDVSAYTLVDTNLCVGGSCYNGVGVAPYGTGYSTASITGMSVTCTT